MAFVATSVIIPTKCRLQKKVSHIPSYCVRMSWVATLKSSKIEGSSAIPEGEQPDLHTKWEQCLQEKGSPECQQCQGSGQIPCPACEGKGYFVMEVFNVTSSNQCQVCRGHRKTPCPTCKEYIYRAVKDL
ncbi:hypothetical protein GAYE_SCF34G4945 [Galdieria yellowstonensis]|uniref:BSD2 cysteine rich domain-containing protein n=1 Tax=Galdieria yellowstonensis TaxID=3028027 RepID=A0AAV9II62_9RHOD|nr:hypothetical protein GAYE_SCF34G4945 [Galdieria yellowstonensis]